MEDHTTDEEKFHSDNSIKSNFFQYYKNNSKTSNLTLQQRRETFLNAHKEKHSSAFDERRDLSELFEEYDCTSDETEGELMEVEKSPRRKKIRFRVSMSEWFTQIPDDLSDKWLVKFCPVGKRRLIISNMGKTKCFNKFGQKLFHFISSLPGGSRKYTKKGGLSVLDCIFNEKTNTFFILDMLVWNSVSFLDCEAELRHCWMRSRFLENPEEFTPYGKNSYTFKFLSEYPADIETIRSEMWLYETKNEVICDGLIFYHRESPYISGLNPLITWLKPFMLPEVLNIDVPQEYDKKRPSNYINLKSYLMNISEKRKRRSQMELMETEESPRN
ncbi:snurportin-1 [Harmonia axyridis]|uniref:snurportin-1 n=1 Tax=Harmonia axyridis TaxID=115357 RepID=UPI001E277979|nr:snurportin-1 [Harmonia axyridis]